jgi:hypothetical protein
MMKPIRTMITLIPKDPSISQPSPPPNPYLKYTRKPTTSITGPNNISAIPVFFFVSLRISHHHSDFIAAPATKRQIPTIAGRKMVSIMIVIPSEDIVTIMILKLSRNQNITATRSKIKPISFRRFFFILTG